MQVWAYDANKQKWGFLCFVLTPGSDDLRNASSWITGKVMDSVRWQRCNSFASLKPLTMTQIYAK